MPPGAMALTLPLQPPAILLCTGWNFWVVVPLFQLILALWHALEAAVCLGRRWLWKPGPALWGALDPHLDWVHTGDIC